jgi:hypothetical protein
MPTNKPDTRAPWLKRTDRLVALALIIGVIIYIIWAYKNDVGGMREIIDSSLKWRPK